MLAIVISLIAIALAGMAQLSFDDGTRSIFRSANPEYAAYVAHVDEFAQSDTTAIILAESDEPFTAAQWAWQRDSIAAIQAISGVEAVFSGFGVNTFHPEAGDVSTMPAEELAGLLDPPRDGRAGSNYAAIDQPLVSEDRRSSVMVVSLSDELQDLATARPVLDRLRTVMAGGSAHDLDVQLTGMVPIREWIIDGVTRDQIVINLVGIVLGFVISLILFRSFWIAALNGIAPALALFLSLGAFGLLGFEINVVRNALPVLILVLAMADCIHMTFEFCETYSETEDGKQAIAAMVRNIAPPCILTSLTTMIAFASLYYSDSPLIQSLSLSGVLAVAIALLVVLFVHPLIFVLALKFGPARDAFLRSRRGIIGGLPTQSLFTWIVARPYRIAALGTATAITVLAIFLPLKTDFRFYEYVEEDAEIIGALERVEAIAGPMQSIDIPLRVAGGESGITTSALDDLRRVHAELATRFPDHPVRSAADVAEVLEAREEWPSWNNVQLALASLPAVVSDSLVSRSGDTLIIRLMTADNHAEETRALIEAADAAAASVSIQSARVEPATGLTVLAANLSDAMIRQLAISFLIAALLCPLIVGLWHRRWQYGVAAILPNLLPIVIVGAWLHWIGWNLQFTSALGLVIAFGIAVDDTVHVLNRHRIQEAAGAGKTRQTVIVGAMNRVTPALVTTTVILIAGLIASLFSTMPTARFFGEICMTVFLLALVADLIVLPAMLSILERQRSQER